MKRFIVIAGVLVFAILAASFAVAGNPFNTRGIPADPRAEFAKAPGSEEVVHGVKNVDGGAWVSKSFRNVSGNLCLSQTVPGEAHGTSCTDAARMFADHRHIYVIVGARQKSGRKRLTWDNLWLQGMASPSVRSLQLVNGDCTRAALTLGDDGAFLHVVSKSDIDRGQVPFKLEARDDAGDLLEERDVSVGLPKNGKEAGLKEPSLGTNCS